MISDIKPPKVFACVRVWPSLPIHDTLEAYHQPQARSATRQGEEKQQMGFRSARLLFVCKTTCILPIDNFFLTAFNIAEATLKWF